MTDERDRQRTVIVDLDGTIADNTARHFTAYDEAGTDSPIWSVIRVVRAIALGGFYRIVYMTGREDYSREVAQAWLDEHGLPPGDLYMRATGDYRPDSEVKSELFDGSGIAAEDVEVVIDDRLSVIEMWRSRGFTVLDVAGHTF